VLGAAGPSPAGVYCIWLSGGPGKLTGCGLSGSGSRYTEGIDKPIVKPQFPMVFDLGSDPGERYNLFMDKLDMGWMIGIARQPIGEYEKSIAQYPKIKPGEEFTGYPAKGAAASRGSAQRGLSYQRR
jgi:hypothetical protein